MLAQPNSRSLFPPSTQSDQRNKDQDLLKGANTASELRGYYGSDRYAVVEDLDTSQLPEALERYGKSSTEHFALTLDASTQASRTAPDGLLHRKRGLSMSSDDTSTTYTRSKERLGNLENGKVVREISTLRNRPPLHRHLSRFLLDTYFETVHPIWPLIIETECRQLFDSIYFFDNASNPTVVSLIYLMMALACEQSERGPKDIEVPAFDAKAVGRDFYKEAQAHIYVNAFIESGTIMLQALLLMGLYQQDTMQFIEFYLTAGHAARMAQSLGFHISRPDKPTVKPQPRELRRRLWWACFCLDR